MRLPITKKKTSKGSSTSKLSNGKSTETLTQKTSCTTCIKSTISSSVRKGVASNIFCYIIIQRITITCISISLCSASVITFVGRQVSTLNPCFDPKTRITIKFFEWSILSSKKCRLSKMSKTSTKDNIPTYRIFVKGVFWFTLPLKTSLSFSLFS